MEIFDLGVIKYQDALEFQVDLVNKRIDGEIPDTLIIAEHEPVVTFGRMKTEGSITDPGFFSERGILFVETGRGGYNTYHAPGQLLLYPVVDLRERGRDISGYIDLLEIMAMKSLKRIGVPAFRKRGSRGVWVSGRKIAFIGVAFKRWIAYHGIAVNINNDISPFMHMKPCGEDGIRVTSAKKVLCRNLSMNTVKKVFVDQFAEELGAQCVAQA